MNVQRRLLARYLGVQRLAVVALFVLLCTEIGLDLLTPQLIRIFIDRIEARRTVTDLVQVASLFLVAVAARVPLRVAKTGASQRAAWAATNALRRDLTAHVAALDLGFHGDNSPGALLERIEGDVRRLGSFFSDLLPGIVSASLLAVGVLSTLFVEDWRLGVTLALFMAAFLVLHRWDQRWAVPQWRKERQYATELSGFVEERVGGTRDVHTAGATAHTFVRFHELLRQHALQGVRAEIVSDASWSASQGFYALGVAAAMVMGGLLFSRGAMSIGTVYLLIHYLETLYRPMAGIGRRLQDLLRSRVSVERIVDLLSTQSALRSRATNALRPEGAMEVRLDRVWFGYHLETPVLRDVSFSLAGGETLGLLGLTGSGKTTLSRLLYRFYDVRRGSIRLDGADVRDLDLAGLRRRVAVVTQNVELFRSSVRDNVTLFRPGIPDTRILEILGRLGLSKWLGSFPQGLDTRISADSGLLSAGQAQLLAVARAFLKDPGLVVLDEASSRLDPATERLLDTAVDSLLSGRTAIIIAHRLATIRRVDSVLILEHGSVREHGRYAELSSRPDSMLTALLRASAGSEPA